MIYCAIEGLLKFQCNDGSWMSFNNVKGCLSVKESGIEFTGDFSVGKATVVNGSVNLNSFINDPTNELLKSIAILGTSKIQEEEQGCDEVDIKFAATNPFLEDIQRTSGKKIHRYSIQQLKDIKHDMATKTLDEIQSLFYPELRIDIRHILLNKNIVATGKTFRPRKNSKSALSTQSDEGNDEKGKKFHRYTVEECIKIRDMNPNRKIEEVHRILNPRLKDYIYFVLFDKDIVVNDYGQYSYIKHEATKLRDEMPQQKCLPIVEVK